jgi:hypothetical protein
LESFRDEAKDFIGIERFSEQRDGLAAFLVELFVDVEVRRHQDGRQVLLGRSRRLNEFDAVPPGHLKIRQQEVDVFGREAFHRLVGVRCDNDAIVLRPEEIRDVLADSFVVIDDEDAMLSAFR